MWRENIACGIFVVTLLTAGGKCQSPNYCPFQSSTVTHGYRLFHMSATKPLDSTSGSPNFSLSARAVSLTDNFVMWRCRSIFITPRVCVMIIHTGTPSGAIGNSLATGPSVTLPPSPLPTSGYDRRVWLCEDVSLYACRHMFSNTSVMSAGVQVRFRQCGAPLYLCYGGSFRQVSPMSTAPLGSGCPDNIFHVRQ